MIVETMHLLGVGEDLVVVGKDLDGTAKSFLVKDGMGKRVLETFCQKPKHNKSHLQLYRLSYTRVPTDSTNDCMCDGIAKEIVCLKNLSNHEKNRWLAKLQK